MCDKESDKTVQVKLTRSSTSSTTTTNKACKPPPIYLNLPGDYSGDVWHAAAAMIVNCNVHVIITVQSDRKKYEQSKTKASDLPKDLKTSARAREFFQACGIKDERVHEVFVGELDFGKDGTSKESSVRDVATANGHIKAARGKLKELKLDDGEVHAVYSSTYIWMSAVRQDPKALQAIRAAFVGSFEERQPDAAKKIRQVVATLSAPAPVESPKKDDKAKADKTKDDKAKEKDDKKDEVKPARKVPFILVNMRMANYHPEDNTSLWVYEQIAAFCKTTEVRLVRVGSWNKDDKTHSAEGRWMESLQTEVVDVFNFCKLKSGLADLQSVAYFWAIAAEQDNCLGVLGGRSGSSDVAGFAGFAPKRLLCWTERRLDDPGYQRQHLMAGRFMSLIDLAADKTDYKPSQHWVSPADHLDKLGYAPCVDFGASADTIKSMSGSDETKSDKEESGEEKKVREKNEKAASNRSKIEDSLSSALQVTIFQAFPKSNAKTFAPTGYGSFEVQDKELNVLVRSPGPVAFCGSGKVDLKLSSLPDGAVYSARDELGKRKRIGTASGEGNNCLIHSVYQLANGEGQGSNEQVAVIRGLLETACPRIQSGAMLDIYSAAEGGDLMANFPNIRVQVIEIQNNGSIIEGPVLGNAGDIKYLLHQGNHYEPLWSL